MFYYSEINLQKLVVNSEKGSIWRSSEFFLREASIFPGKKLR